MPWHGVLEPPLQDVAFLVHPEGLQSKGHEASASYREWTLDEDSRPPAPRSNCTHWGTQHLLRLVQVPRHKSGTRPSQYRCKQLPQAMLLAWALLAGASQTLPHPSS